jgi:hypothetical protein
MGMASFTLTIRSILSRAFQDYKNNDATDKTDATSPTTLEKVSSLDTVCIPAQMF